MVAAGTQTIRSLPRPRSGSAAKTWTLLLPAILVIVGTTSCSLIKVRRTTEMPVELPENFSQAGEAAMMPRWWESLDDPELNGLIEKALSGNFDLQAAWDRLEQSAALARKAGSAIRPSLNAEASASRTRSDRETLLGRGGSSDIGAISSDLADGSGTTISNWFSLGLSASYEVDLWGKVRSATRAAEFNLLASREDLSAAAITLSAEVANTWYGVVQQRAVIKILAEQVKTNGEFLELVELRFKNGRASAVDVLQQRRHLERTKGEVPIARMQLEVLAHQLAVLLGKAPLKKVSGTLDVLPKLPPPPATGLPAEVLRRRPDLRAAHARLASADQSVASAIADRFPALRITGRVQTDAEEIEDVFDDWLANLAGSLIGPVIDGGRRAAEVERARAVASERLNDYGRLVLNAFREVEDALVRERRQREYLSSLEKQIDLSRQVVKQSRLRYMQGASDYLPVLEALNTLHPIERSGFEARRLLIEYRISLYRALGGGWEMKRTRRTDTTVEIDSGDKI